MQFLSKSHLKRWGIVALLPVLTACSLTPGMRMDDKYLNAKTDEAVEAAGMKHITLELVQAERRDREQLPGQDISALVAAHPTRYERIFASRDWHDAEGGNNGHFATDADPEFVDTWPVHCVAGTRGAAAPGLGGLIRLPCLPCWPL